MKRFAIAAAFAALLALTYTPSLHARFPLPIYRLDCSTAGPGGGGTWEVGCNCVQHGWVRGGMIIPDDVISCTLGMGANDYCNFHGQCQMLFGGNPGGDLARKSDNTKERTHQKPSFDKKTKKTDSGNKDPIPLTETH